MEKCTIILLGLMFCQCSDENNSIQEKTASSNNSKIELIDELPKELSGKDAVNLLMKTSDFQIDSQNKTDFELKIDSFANESNNFHCFRTVYIEGGNVKKIISYYRVDSKSGDIEKKILKEDEWRKIN